MLIRELIVQLSELAPDAEVCLHTENLPYYMMLKYSVEEGQLAITYVDKVKSRVIIEID